MIYLEISKLNRKKRLAKTKSIIEKNIAFFLRGADNHRIRSERTIKKKKWVCPVWVK